MMEDYFYKKKAVIKLGYSCNNNCLFCWGRRWGKESEIDLNTEDIKKKIDLAKNLDVKTIVITGGEATIRRDLFEITKYIQNQGFSLGLATNGRMLSYQHVLDRLIKHGLLFLHISFYCHRKEIYEKITRTKSFEEAFAGIKNSVNRKLNPLINIVINRYNMHELKDFIDVLSRIGVKNFRLSYVEPAGEAEKNVDIIPRIPEASAVIKEGMDYGISKNLKMGFEGIPFCHFPEYVSNFADLKGLGIDFLSEAFEEEFFPIDYVKYEKVEECDGCGIKECPGIFKNYIELFGSEDLNLEPFQQ